jgi:hypothetical protein
MQLSGERSSFSGFVNFNSSVEPGGKAGIRSRTSALLPGDLRPVNGSTRRLKN